MPLPTRERLRILEEVSLGFESSSRPAFATVASSQRAMDYWGGEKALREVYLYYWRSQFSGAYRNSAELVDATQARWEGYYWHARYQIYREENPETLSIRDLSRQRVTLYHVGNTPVVDPQRNENSGQFSASLLEALRYGAREGIPIWAIDVPFASLTEIMKAINPYFYWSEKIQINRDPQIWPEAYALRQIGKSLGGLSVFFEDLEGRELVLYGDLRRMQGEYLRAAKYCRDHGELPLAIQRRVVIPSGTTWTLPEPSFGNPRTNQDDLENENRWRKPFFDSFWPHQG